MEVRRAGDGQKVTEPLRPGRLGCGRANWRRRPLKSDDQPSSTPRLPLSLVLPFSTPALPLSALGVIVFVSLPPYFAGHLGVSMTVIGAVWMLVRLLDIPVDVLLAIVMDRTRTPLGRYRLWLILGAPVLML